MSDVNHILDPMETRDGNAAEELLPLVYGELRRLAAARMTREAPGQTLQPTALVHEALPRLAVADACAANVVKLCFFVGLTQEEAARELNVSVSTVERR